MSIIIINGVKIMKVLNIIGPESVQLKHFLLKLSGHQLEVIVIKMSQVLLKTCCSCAVKNKTKKLHAVFLPASRENKLPVIFVTQGSTRVGTDGSLRNTWSAFNRETVWQWC